MTVPIGIDLDKVQSHQMCDKCWEIMKLARGKRRISFRKETPEVCCYCGQLNVSGIYVTAEPVPTKCQCVRSKE